MFGYPEFFSHPGYGYNQYPTQRRYAAPEQPRRRVPQSSYDPFGFGDNTYYRQPTHRPQQHTSYGHPAYTNPLHAYQRNSDEDTSSSDEEEYLQQRPRRYQQQPTRLETEPEHLIPQKRPLKHPQQSRQFPPHKQQQQQYEETLHQKQHQQQQHQVPIRTAPKVAKKVDYNQEALKIQRRWRGWNVRKLDLIHKLGAIKVFIPPNFSTYSFNFIFLIIFSMLFSMFSFLFLLHNHIF